MLLNKVKLSIIIPIYNVETYLRKCVDSALMQDLLSSEYEIILVDDGSTDGSGELCDEIVHANDEMSRADALNEQLPLNDGKPIIRVIHQKNGGLSAARNSGIEVAKGEYVMFIDSDDYIEQNVLGVLMKQVEREDLDVLRYDYQNVRIVNSEELMVNSDDGVKYEVFEPNKTKRQIDMCSAIVDGVTYLNTRMGYACYAWQWIIRRSLIYNDGMSRTNVLNEPRALNDVCLFTEGIHFEDVDWMPRMMLRAKRVNSTQTVVYNYFWREGSITLTQGNKDKIRKNVEDQMYIVGQYGDYLATFPNCKWLRNMQSSLVAAVLTSVARDFYDERKEYMRRMRELNVYPLTIANQGKTYIRRARIINMFGTGVYIMLMHLR